MGLYTAKGLANSLAPRFSANAYTGVYTIGSADLMLSLDGDQIHNLYVNPQATYGTDQQWLVDLGSGYRWIINDAANSTVRGITTQTGGSAFMELGNLSVTSPSPNAEITSGSNISLFAVECLLNGTTVVC